MNHHDDPDYPGLAPDAFLLTWSALRKQELSIAAEAVLTCWRGSACLAKARYLMGFTWFTFDEIFTFQTRLLTKAC